LEEDGQVSELELVVIQDDEVYPEPEFDDYYKLDLKELPDFPLVELDYAHPVEVQTYPELAGQLEDEDLGILLESTYYSAVDDDSSSS